MSSGMHTDRGTYTEALNVRNAANHSTKSFATFADEFVRFFEEFEEPTPINGTSIRSKKSKNKQKSQNTNNKKYANLLLAASRGTVSSVDVHVDDLFSFFSDDASLEKKGAGGIMTAVLHNTKRAICILHEAANRIVAGGDAMMAEAKVPIHLRSPYDIHLIPASSAPSIPLREIRARHMGSLLKVDGLVSRVSGSKPRMQVARYACGECGSLAFQPVEGREFMPQTVCHSTACQRTSRRGDLAIDIVGSKMTRHQEVQVQELSDQVPHGNVPRSIKVMVEGDLTRRLSPGVAVTLGGVLVPIQKSGFAAMKRGLVTETTLEVHWIQQHKCGYATEMEALTEEEVADKLREIDDCPNVYERISSGIAPSIHGHEDIKRALLLQMVGGVRETFGDGLKIRGDLHILLMGDPGVAKSQLLGQICKIAPRAHYTAGKGTSGVGLTASVTRDPISNEFVLEGGAIVLSDRGICCIDEFDKMDESDRTCIHEVMEQQTVSIAKAGLVTSLNARTSILAAANPAYGRYDPTKSPMANMNLPAALLSRFDLQFLLLDSADRKKDFDLAKHIIFIHGNRRAPDGEGGGVGSSSSSLDARTIRLFVARARQIDPKLPAALIEEVAENYVDLRSRDRQEIERSADPYGARNYTSPRTLLAILRMSQALARIRRSEFVEREDVEEAMRLATVSKQSIGTEENRRGREVDYRSGIIRIVKEMDRRMGRRRDWDGWMSVQEIGEAAEKIGYNNEEVMGTLREYVELEVLVFRGKGVWVGFMERVKE